MPDITISNVYPTQIVVEIYRKIIQMTQQGKFENDCYTGWLLEYTRTVGKLFCGARRFALGRCSGMHTSEPAVAAFTFVLSVHLAV
jgi:hypothetical protein